MTAHERTGVEMNAWERAWYDEFFTDALTLRERLRSLVQRWRDRQRPQEG